MNTDHTDKMGIINKMKICVYPCPKNLKNRPHPWKWIHCAVSLRTKAGGNHIALEIWGQGIIIFIKNRCNYVTKLWQVLSSALSI